ncbi:LiaI-LiaF-like domain-containing protein [Vulcaniibacterium gelatinicum]|uniref:LiaI-LiaF-like domain-containing protein n=1 Tax=Vulcaniibacterium gelatinicum TaxID=2598725 RepID=UPI0011C99812|nr:DUF5668 domain-containing protein [Vulcaniibacterium gelatinicum]
MKSNLTGALVLIAIGTLFLLRNLDLIDMDLGDLISTWWPAILIVVGVGMLLKRDADSKQP